MDSLGYLSSIYKICHEYHLSANVVVFTTTQDQFPNIFVIATSPFRKSTKYLTWSSSLYNGPNILSNTCLHIFLNWYQKNPDLTKIISQIKNFNYTKPNMDHLTIAWN